jgi:hypothetical protein
MERAVPFRQKRIMPSCGVSLSVEIGFHVADSAVGRQSKWSVEGYGTGIYPPVAGFLPPLIGQTSCDANPTWFPNEVDRQRSQYELP